MNPVPLHFGQTPSVTIGSIIALPSFNQLEIDGGVAIFFMERVAGVEQGMPNGAAVILASRQFTAKTDDFFLSRRLGMGGGAEGQRGAERPGAVAPNVHLESSVAMRYNRDS